MSKETMDVLAMGAVEFPGQGQERIPAAELLVRRTQELWGGVEPFLNADFTVESLVRENGSSSESFGIIHLSTHGRFRGDFVTSGNENSGLSQNQSYIQFYDQRLMLAQAPSLRLNLNHPATELFVLSACQTALGSPAAELGFAGFAHQIGVKSVIASLWRVRDDGTTALMQTFYQILRQGNTFKADALRQAQLAMQRGQVRIENGVIIDIQGNTTPLPDEYSNLTSENLSHPYYWSGFTVVGTPW
jgi:CHAT domain-containing protein